uniref:Uncharacterized protein n=1 Tax=Rhizophora mucronata TaxID=61149 RepID=A0A2P2PQS9_RHIMU
MAESISIRDRFPDDKIEQFNYIKQKHHLKSNS